MSKNFDVAGFVLDVAEAFRKAVNGGTGVIKAPRTMITEFTSEMEKYVDKNTVSGEKKKEKKGSKVVEEKGSEVQRLEKK